MTISNVCACTIEERWAELLRLAAEHARSSPDPSTQNGGLLCTDDAKWVKFDTWSVNEFPRGVAYSDERWERPLKYSIIEHAERNAIYAAARHGIRTEGLTLVCVWAACTDCARAIIQAGIKRLVTLAPVQEAHGNWGASIDIAMVMLKEAGVEVVYVEGPLNVTLRRNGQEFFA
jgi:dCMP deaminase